MLSHNIFPLSKFDYSSRDKIIDSIVNIIKSNSHIPVKRYLPLPSWFYWAVWQIQIEEHWFGKKKKWEKKHLQTSA